MKNEIKEFIRTFAEEELGADLSEDADLRRAGWTVYLWWC